MVQQTRADSATDSASIDLTLEWLVVALAVALPLYRPWVSLASHLIIVLWLLAPGLRQRLERLRRHPLTWALLAFVALNLLSLAWSADRSQGLHYVVKYRYLLLVPMIGTILPPRRWRTVAAGFVGGAVLAALLSLTVAAGLVRFGEATPGNPSPMMAHLDFCLVLAVGSLWALVQALDDGGRHMPATSLWAASSLLLATTLAVNIGRAGQLGFAAGLLAVLGQWAWRRSRTTLATFAILVVAGTVALAIISPPAVDRLRTGADELRLAVTAGEYESNIGGRLAALVVTTRMVREHPFAGTGVGANMVEFRHLLDTEYPDYKPAVYWYQHLHNQYAQVVTELGLVGLLALAWIFREILRPPQGSLTLARTAVFLTAVYGVGFVGEPYLRKQIPLVAFALVAGVIAAGQLDRRTKAAEVLEPGTSDCDGQPLPHGGAQDSS
jgi:O-antigen ligase